MQDGVLEQALGAKEAQEVRQEVPEEVQEEVQGTGWCTREAVPREWVISAVVAVIILRGNYRDPGHLGCDLSRWRIFRLHL